MSYTQSPKQPTPIYCAQRRFWPMKFIGVKDPLKEAFEVERLWNGWCEVRHYDYRYCIVGAVYESGVPENIAPEFVDDEKTYELTYRAVSFRKSSGS